MSRAILDMVLRLPISEVKKVMGADDYNELDSLATPSEKIVLGAIASQIMREMEGQ